MEVEYNEDITIAKKVQSSARGQKEWGTSKSIWPHSLARLDGSCVCKDQTRVRETCCLSAMPNVRVSILVFPVDTNTWHQHSFCDDLGSPCSLEQRVRFSLGRIVRVRVVEQVLDA